MNFRKVNNITGWIVCVIACVTYILTREATASLWDTGEFIAVANEMGVPHPPGSPLFSMMGRLFILLFSGGNDANVASSVNLLSATASGFTILFLFWTITHFARKMFVGHGESLSMQQTVTVMIAGITGALAYTFSDTFWFDAVEGEVYALSSFFTALIIWSMLKWEHTYEMAQTIAEKTRADRWIVFIFFMIGLSITVHLLNLLTVPAIVMIYFYKKFNATVGKSILAFLVGCGITGLILLGMVYWIPKWSAAFDRMFVNSLDMPFFSGFAFFFILVGFLCWLGLKIAGKRGLATVRLGIWCFLFILLGFSTYVTTLIRSNANPAIDMSNVDNPMSLASYFGREQYGSAPLLYGPHFGARPFDEDGNGSRYIEKGMRWGKLGKKYVEIGKEVDYEFAKKDLMFFPRMWDWQDQQDHLRFYATWLGKTAYRNADGGLDFEPEINYKDNINWFFSYQMSLMYWRYFMWNFAGRQNDLQGFGNRRDGNWQSGISLIDNQMLGDQSKVPAALKNARANNKLYLLPFLLGILGCVYHFLKKRKDWVVNFLLFFFTGIAIGLYLNMPGNQPRERDYAFVGSFYAFAVWIGLGMVGFVKLVKESKESLVNTIIYGSVLSFVITAFSLMNFSGGAVLKTAILVAAAFALYTAAVTYLLKAVSSGGKNEKIVNIVAGIICLIVPLLMASQEWDDHDRSKKTLARDNARNYLESCDKNAILFTFGDNDTYPLWYVQEVEKVRPDIRIINTSLLGIDWYINQLRYKINQSDSMDVIFSPAQIIGDNRQFLQYYPRTNIPKDEYYDLHDLMKNYLADDRFNDGSFPAKRFKIPVDTVLVRKNGTVNPDDAVLSELRFELPANAITRDQLIILSIIATNQWKRPVYFTSTANMDLGLGNYLRKDGLTYRLVPIANNSGINTNWVLNKLTTHFTAGNATTKGVYFDEENRRHLLGIRQVFGELARDLISKNRKEEAKMILLKADSLIPSVNMPYGLASRFEQHNSTSFFMMQSAYDVEAKELGDKIKKELTADVNEQMVYYASMGDDMSRKQLEDILTKYNQMSMSAQISQSQEQRNQAEGYFRSSLNNNQISLANEIARNFELVKDLRQLDERNNPTPPIQDSLNKKPDSPAIKKDTPK